MRPKNLSDRGSQTGPATSGTSAKIAGILMEECRKDRFSHVVANRKITVRCYPIVRVGLAASAERRIRPGELALARKRRGKRNRAAVESVLRRDPKLLTRRQGLVFPQPW